MTPCRRTFWLQTPWSLLGGLFREVRCGDVVRRRIRLCSECETAVATEARAEANPKTAAQPTAA